MSDATDLLAHDFGTLPELIRLHAATDPRRIALIHEDRQLDYGALDALLARVAASLQRDGLHEEDAIAICAANSIAYAVVFIGALRAGVAVALLAPSATATSLADMFRDSGARHFFVDRAAAATLAPVRDAIDATTIALDDSSAGTHLTEWLRGDTPPRPARIAPSAAFNIIYSSGTTGVPKGIAQPHSMRWAHMQRAPAFNFGPDSTTLISTPLYSNTTLVAFFPPLAMGGTVLLMTRFDVAGYLELAARQRVTHTMLVPVQYQRIMAHPAFGEHDLTSFRIKFSTSAPLAAALKADIVKRWPGGLVEYYGMTEGGGTCILAAHEHPEKLHTVGRPAPGHDIRLIDEEGIEVPAGAIGEVVGHSRAMMTGYHGKPEPTRAVEWFDATGKRFIRTGDIGRFDADGFLTLLDRRKDMIISGGFNVYPSDIEAAMREHPAIAEVAVIGVPSSRWGETPVACVVVREGSAVDAATLLAWTNARVGKVQRIAAVELLDALPRSPIGKVLKRELRERFRTSGEAQRNVIQ